LYECHCCLRLVCLNHLNEHVQITKQNRQRFDSLRNGLNTIVNTLKQIVKEKLLTIEREQNLIEQGSKILDVSSSSIDELESIFEEISQTIASNHSKMVKLEPSLSETKYSSCDQHENEVEVVDKQILYRSIVKKCSLTFDGAYGLTQANHSIEFCDHRTTRRIELYLHFMYKHRIKKVYAQRLVRAVADNKDPRKTKLFDENENVIDHFYKVACPFFHGRINSLKSSQQNVMVSPCQRRLIAFNRLTYHLRHSHKISKSSAQKIVDGFKKDRAKNDIALAPLITSI
ncbi:unnamed protein product, partial [Rotaria sp. Silwood2]